ncbi:polymer-forming cytoskeletal protein [Deinococcus sp. YIM 134068]|uniref:polymer-forming cytoskeletal protein n=1 Tax=Deinococcus lichenicola TaxID=3118910 RepID=UPI002F925352
MDREWRDELDLLHREAEGELTPGERARLALLLRQTEVEDAARRLAGATDALRSLERPTLPRSCARPVAEEVAWSARLQTSSPPPAPHGVAASVGAEVALAAQLAATPAPARSVAGEVVAAIRTAAALSDLPPLGRSVAAAVASEVAWSARLARPAPLPATSLASHLAGRIAGETAVERSPTVVPNSPAHNPAPLLLVSGLLVGLTLLAVTSAWPNLAAGATVLQTLVAQVSPLAGVGLALLLGVSLLVTWRPTPTTLRLGTGAFVLSAVLTLPPLYEAFGRSGVTVGHDLTVSGPVRGNVIAVGGDVTLSPSARVDGEVITLFGDVRRQEGARVTGRVNALLGRAPGDTAAIQTAPPSGLSAATATAFRPLLGWLGGAAWGPIFLLLTGGMLLLLFVTGVAPTLARRQRHAPVRTLALGVLALAVLIGPALGLALVGLLVPALLATAFALLTLATGLSVSAYDAGRALAFRLRLPRPDALGALLGLCAVALSLGVPPLALTFGLVGGAWGAGTLLLTRTGEAREAAA